ncbi:MAG: GIY-YIG nuclease family protein [Ruminococcaceae bacterium]|nr:GIY-YIG nuclease family protein [Oscillospiraceae bacterium]
MHFVYILRCCDNTLYTGWTTNVLHRVYAHNSGHGAKYTRSRLPVTLVYTEVCADKSTALKREKAIKKLTKQKKEQLIQTANGLYHGV